MRGKRLLLFAAVVGTWIAAAASAVPAEGGPGVWPYLQDDAASGRDAPDEPVPEVSIEPGVVYEGTLAGVLPPLLVDWSDHYAFTGDAGDVVRAKARGMVGCMRVLDAGGVVLGDVSCSLAGWDVLFPDGDETGIMTGPPLEVVLADAGVHYIQYSYFQPQQYRFAFALNGEAPEPGVLGARLPPGPPL